MNPYISHHLIWFIGLKSFFKLNFSNKIPYPSSTVLSSHSHVNPNLDKSIYVPHKKDAPHDTIFTQPLHSSEQTSLRKFESYLLQVLSPFTSHHLIVLPHKLNNVTKCNLPPKNPIFNSHGPKRKVLEYLN